MPDIWGMEIPQEIDWIRATVERDSGNSRMTSDTNAACAVADAMAELERWDTRITNVRLVDGELIFVSENPIPPSGTTDPSEDTRTTVHKTGIRPCVECKKVVGPHQENCKSGVVDDVMAT